MDCCIGISNKRDSGSAYNVYVGIKLLFKKFDTEQKTIHKIVVLFQKHV